MPKIKKLEIYGCCLHPLSYGASEQQDVPGYFQQNKRPPTESIKLTWHTLITTLRAQYERIDGTRDASKLMRLKFRKRWCVTLMVAEIGVDIRWQYVVPRWLFPPPIR